jgi:hypothetical protein
MQDGVPTSVVVAANVLVGNGLCGICISAGSLNGHPSRRGSQAQLRKKASREDGQTCHRRWQTLTSVPKCGPPTHERSPFVVHFKSFHACSVHHCCNTTHGPRTQVTVVCGPRGFAADTMAHKKQSSVASSSSLLRTHQCARILQSALVQHMRY